MHAPMHEANLILDTSDWSEFMWREEIPDPFHTKDIFEVNKSDRPDTGTQNFI